MRKIKVIAHRGASDRAPENSLEAFEIAVAMGADMVEMDVRSTADGAPVIMHDESLDRTTGRKGLVRALGIAEVRVRRLANSEPVPTLEEALACLKGKCGVNLELKDAASAEPACHAVAEAGMVPDVQFSSFDTIVLERVRASLPGARIAVVSDSRRSGFLERARNLEAEAVNLSHRIASEGEVGRAHLAGMAVNVWTVNRPDLMKSIISGSADGIITDRLNVLLRVLGRLPP